MIESLIDTIEAIEKRRNAPIHNVKDLLNELEKIKKEELNKNENKM